MTSASLSSARPFAPRRLTLAGALALMGALAPSAVVAGCRRAPPACNTLANQAPRVTFTARPGPPPAFSGGTIRDGVYEAARAEGYGAAAPSGRRMTLAVSDGGTRFSWAGELLDPSGATATASIRAEAAVVAAGVELTLTTLCTSVAPSPLPDHMRFTATPERLVLGFVEGTSASVTTYERRRDPIGGRMIRRLPAHPSGFVVYPAFAVVGEI